MCSKTHFAALTLKAPAFEIENLSLTDNSELHSSWLHVIGHMWATWFSLHFNNRSAKGLFKTHMCVVSIGTSHAGSCSFA